MAVDGSDQRYLDIRLETPPRATSEGGRRRRPHRPRMGFVAIVVVLTVSAGGALWFQGQHSNDGASPAAASPSRTSVPSHPSTSGSATQSAPAGLPSTRASGPSQSASPGLVQSTSPTPTTARGTGIFVTATGRSSSVGKGKIRRYRVESEEGMGVDADAAAQQIHSILSDKRSWITDGKNGFQLVDSGPYDFVVKIASPATTDAICAEGGLNTHGEVNCSVGNQVVVNIKRWNTGSPEFSGPVDEYRALIINHEVGHRIGHGHETCPGPGKPAPAMMQQIDGLKGCVANAWPYDAKGTYLGGPAVP
ncbi:DUF3152 domain-containing protein [Kitasatospora sp. NPDC001603]|uniref:DUF3152 domain-containing protein n=1 Tax=Kitasatospora sp. NPDC001603 TaxID=3154388 RepID=UPI0033311D8F